MSSYEGMGLILYGHIDLKTYYIICIMTYMFKYLRFDQHNFQYTKTSVKKKYFYFLLL